MILRFNKENELSNFLKDKDAIYHYTKINKGIEFIWNNNSLMFGGFIRTHDPHEYKPRRPAVHGIGWDKEIQKQLPIITRKIDERIKSSGFLSFCQNSYTGLELKEQGCLKSRMWSQYSEGHGGMCFVFSKQKTLEELKKQYSETHFIYSQNVTYKDMFNSRVKDSVSVNGPTLSQEEIDEVVEEYILEKKEEIFFVKLSDYKDENEFRVVVLAKEKSMSAGFFLDIAPCLKAVLVGDNFPKVYDPTLLKLSERTNVPCRRIHWEKNSFSILEIKN